MENVRERENEFYTEYQREYGLVPMTFLEEMGLPETVSQTRRCKVRIVDRCRLLVRAANAIQLRATQIPEEDDLAHAELVSKLDEAVNRVCQMLGEAERIGVI